MAGLRRRDCGAATSLAGSEDGAAILEFVLVLPIMLALIGGAFELGRILLVHAALEAGVRGGVRYLARVADPSCNAGCSPGAAHAMSLARDRILENTRLIPSRLRVEPLANAGPGHVGLRAEADVSVDLLGWVALSPMIRLSATHRERHVGE